MKIMCPFCSEDIEFDDQRYRNFEGLLRCPHCKHRHYMRTGPNGEILTQQVARGNTDAFV